MSRDVVVCTAGADLGPCCAWANPEFPESITVLSGETRVLDASVTEVGSVVVAEGGTLAFDNDIAGQRLVAGIVSIEGSVVGAAIRITAQSIVLSSTGRISSDGAANAERGGASVACVPGCGVTLAVGVWA